MQNINFKHELLFKWCSYEDATFIVDAEVVLLLHSLEFASVLLNFMMRACFDSVTSVARFDVSHIDACC